MVLCAVYSCHCAISARRQCQFPLLAVPVQSGNPPRPRIRCGQSNRLDRASLLAMASEDPPLHLLRTRSWIESVCKSDHSSAGHGPHGYHPPSRTCGRLSSLVGDRRDALPHSHFGPAIIASLKVQTVAVSDSNRRRTDCSRGRRPGCLCWHLTARPTVPALPCAGP